MINNYIHFYSQTPCNLFINGELIGLIDNNDNFFVDIVEYNEELIISCEPLCNNNEIYIPISFKLHFDKNKLCCSTDNIIVVPYPNNNFDIIISFKQANILSSNSIESKKIGAYNIFVLNDNISTVSIYSNDKNIFTTTTGKIENIQTEAIADSVVIHSKTDKGIFLTILNSKTKEVILSNTFLAVERSKNIIKTLLKTNKILNTAQVVEINLETLDIQKYNVYLDNNNITETNLVPFYFLEAIKQEDYNLAISYVDTTLNNVNQSKLKQYFGKIKDIYYNCYNLNKDYCNYTIFSPKPRNFNFYIQNYKISEIEEIELFI